MSRLLLACFVCALLSVPTFADQDVDAKLPASVKRAQAQQDDELKKAETVYLKAALSAKRTYLQSANAAIAESMKAGRLDEANAVNEVKQQLERDIEGMSLQLAGWAKKVVKVSARGDWQGAIDLAKGEAVQIVAEGTWCSNTRDPKSSTVDANGEKKRVSSFIPNSPYSCLIGQLADERFVVGRALKMTARTTGTLEFRINDAGTDDNGGELTVTIFFKQ